jgi:hypothetical protein
MPIQIRFSAELGLAVAEFVGVITADEFDERVAPLLGQPQYSLVPLSLVDMMAAERWEAPTERVRRHAEQASQAVDQEIPGAGKLAFAAENDEFFGLSRMYGLLRDGSPVEVSVFRSREEAEAWLGLPSDYRTSLVDIG